MKTHFKIWIAESYSCQIDIIQLLKTASIASSLTIYCSHSRLRLELQQAADVFIQQPSLDESAEWLFAQCKSHQIDLLFCGKHGELFEPLRTKFEAAQIQLVTGAMNQTAHELINHKYYFSERCQQLGLPNIPAALVLNSTDLKHAIAAFKARYHRICAKPVHGVYAAGFVQLKDDVSYFRHFQHPTHCHIQQFIEAYEQQDEAIPYLIMPFLAGTECSVDIACNRGKILELVTRVKFDFYQECYTEHPCHEFAHALVKAFDCDGLINIQFKQDEQQQWHILEINPRPAGGFAYTQHTGINLIAALIAHKLGLNFQSKVQQETICVLPQTYSIAMGIAS